MLPFSYPIVHFFRLRTLNERKSGKCTLHLKPLHTSTLSGLLCCPHQTIPLSGLQSESLSFPNVQTWIRLIEILSSVRCFATGVFLGRTKVEWEGLVQFFSPKLCTEQSQRAPHSPSGQSSVLNWPPEPGLGRLRERGIEVSSLITTTQTTNE